MEKIVHICLFPCDIPSAMNVYARKVTMQLAKIDPENEEQLVAFLAEHFYQLTEIHPFANGNGRVATCLMNVFLRHFNLPSILLRYPGECDDANSQYSKAVAQINITREPLKDLIRYRINEAKKHAFCDDKQKQLICLRVALSEVLQRTHKNHPAVYLNALEKEISESTLLAARFATPADAAILYLTDMITIVSNKEKALNDARSKPNYSLTLLTDEQKTWLIQGLTALTQVEGWKVNVRNGIKPWIQLTDATQAKNLSTFLGKLDIGNCKCAQTADKKGWVVLIEDVSYHRINTVAINEAHHNKLRYGNIPNTMK